MRTTPTYARLARLLVPVAVVALAGAALGGGPVGVSASASATDGQAAHGALIGLLPPIGTGGCGSPKKPDLWDELFPACPQRAA